MSDNAISMKEPMDKLRRLEELMEDETNGILPDFGRFIADRLNPELVPQGFVLACQLAIYDLERGVDGLSGKPIQNRLVDYPPMVYRLIRASIPQIAKVVFPPEFAAEIESFQQQVDSRIAKKNS